MKTKLEMMIGYLAGRQGESAESIRRELRDPASEASRWLEAVRLRSRTVLDVGRLEARSPNPTSRIGDGIPTRRPERKRRLMAILGASAAAIAFLGLAATWRAQEGRLTRLERMLGHQQARWDDRFNRLDTILARREMERPSQTSSSKVTTAREVIPAAPTGSLPELALARIEARLTEFGKRLEEAAPGQPQGDPMIDQLRRDVERLGQQAEARARASREELQSVNMVLQEVLQTLTRLALSSRGAEPMQVPVPIPVFPQGQLPGLGQGAGMLPGPGQDPMSGQDASRAGPGQDNRGRGVRNHSESRPNPRR
jgi:hypothetical protein